MSSVWAVTCCMESRTPRNHAYKLRWYCSQRGPTIQNESLAAWHSMHEQAGIKYAPPKILIRLVVGFPPSGAGVNLSPYSFFITHFHTSSSSSSSSSSFYIIISPSFVLSGLVLGFHHKFPKFKSFYPKISSHLAHSFIIFIIISGIS